VEAVVGMDGVRLLPRSGAYSSKVEEAVFSDVAPGVVTYQTCTTIIGGIGEGRGYSCRGLEDLFG
jgi:hypothetical protein